MTYLKAIELAERITAALSPYCAKIEIAGSIRRGRETCNDIDIVALPHPGQLSGLLSRAKANAEVVSSGGQATILRLRNGVQLDLWIARDDDRDLVGVTPGNWGTLLLCRTGSREHNIWLAQKAAGAGLHWDPHHGLKRGDQVVASRTEAEVYEALGLHWVPPAFRHPPIPPEYLYLPAVAPPPERQVSQESGSAQFERIRARLAAVSAPAAAGLAPPTP